MVAAEPKAAPGSAGCLRPFCAQLLASDPLKIMPKAAASAPAPIFVSTDNLWCRLFWIVSQFILSHYYTFGNGILQQIETSGNGFLPRLKRICDGALWFSPFPRPPPPSMQGPPGDRGQASSLSQLPFNESEQANGQFEWCSLSAIRL